MVLAVLLHKSVAGLYFSELNSEGPLWPPATKPIPSSVGPHTAISRFLDGKRERIMPVNCIGPVLNSSEVAEPPPEMRMLTPPGRYLPTGYLSLLLGEAIVLETAVQVLSEMS